MSVTTIHRHFFHNDTGSTIQLVSKFSAEVKAGATYLLKDDNKLVDANTGEIVANGNFFDSRNAADLFCASWPFQY